MPTAVHVEYLVPSAAFGHHAHHSSPFSTIYCQFDWIESLLRGKYMFRIAAQLRDAKIDHILITSSVTLGKL